MKLHSLVVALSLVALVACSKEMVTAPTTATPAPAVVAAAESFQGPIVEEHDFSCSGRDREVQHLVAGVRHPSGILTLSNHLNVFLQDTRVGYDIYDNPGNWCLGGSGGVGNVTHITTYDVALPLR